MNETTQASIARPMVGVGVGSFPESLRGHFNHIHLFLESELRVKLCSQEGDLGSHS